MFLFFLIIRLFFIFPYCLYFYFSLFVFSFSNTILLHTFNILIFRSLFSMFFLHFISMSALPLDFWNQNKQKVIKARVSKAPEKTKIYFHHIFVLKKNKPEQRCSSTSQLSTTQRPLTLYFLYLRLKYSKATPSPFSSLSGLGPSLITMVLFPHKLCRLSLQTFLSVAHQLQPFNGKHLLNT